MEFKKAIKPNITKLIISLLASISWYLWIWYKESQIMYDFACDNLPCSGIPTRDLLPGPDCGCITLSQITFQAVYIIWPAIIAYVVYSLIQKLKK
ncbi:MAG: hypothetical protein Q7U36_02835 [bacterium]|nr:hypothetical protein [bacterium]